MLKCFKGFQNFVKYNGISNESIEIAAGLIIHEKIPKGKCIFNQGDASEYFYGVIKGRIQIKKNVEITKERDITDLKKGKLNLLKKLPFMSK